MSKNKVIKLVFINGINENILDSNKEKKIINAVQDVASDNGYTLNLITPDENFTVKTLLFEVDGNGTPQANSWFMKELMESTIRCGVDFSIIGDPIYTHSLHVKNDNAVLWLEPDEFDEDDDLVVVMSNGDEYRFKDLIDDYGIDLDDTANDGYKIADVIYSIKPGENEESIHESIKNTLGHGRCQECDF